MSADAPRAAGSRRGLDGLRPALAASAAVAGLASAVLLVAAGARGALARAVTTRDYLEAILEDMADMLLVTCSRGVIKTVNRAAVRALGDGLVGRPLASVLESERELRPARDLETAASALDGRRIPVLISASPLRDRGGRVQGWICVLRDITERKRAEEALLAAKAAAEASSRELEAFSYSVAHDLRAPLRAVDGFSQAVLEGYGERLDERGRDYLRRARAGSRRMGRLIDDLLNLSRITRSTMDVREVDLGGLAREAAEEQRRAEPERRVSFSAADGALVKGDESLLRSAMGNLMSNAWKYTGRNPDAHVEFGVETGGARPAYFVRDDGVGFDMAFETKLFQPFSRLHAAAEFEGTGIGLAIVQRVIARHGGRIWASGAPGRGATFYFTLWETRPCPP